MTFELFNHAAAFPMSESGSSQFILSISLLLYYDKEEEFNWKTLAINIL